MIRLVKLVTISAVPLLMMSCSKSAFLNTKPDQSLVVPVTLQDFQKLLDNDDYMNGTPGGQGLIPQLGETGADNYYLPDAVFSGGLNQYAKNCYIWEKLLNTGEQVFDWDIPYRSVFTANVVLDGIKKLTVPTDKQAELNNIEGSALFYRAHCFYQLAQVFAPHFNQSNAATALGIPLRMTSAIDEKITRAKLDETYNQITGDLQRAGQLLPAIAAYKTRPSRVAVFALLSRVFLTMQDYDKALLYSDSALQIQNTLLDYNTLDPNNFTPVPRFNDEVIFSGTMIAAGSVPVSPGTAVVDSSLYNTYNANDLRKAVFFKDFGYIFFLGSYDESLSLFAGLATDELYLIRAECNARKGNKDAALDDLNTLMKMRWSNSVTFQPYTAADSAEALAIILRERRKELLFRGLRWTDLRRLNDEGAKIQLERIVNGQLFVLKPGDPRYTYPIPDYIIDFNPGMQQNER